MKTLICLLLAIGCCVTIVVFLSKLDASNEKEISSKGLDFIPKPKKGSVIHYMYKDIKSVKRWTRKITEFLKRMSPIYLQKWPLFKLLTSFLAYNVSNQTECNFNHFPSPNETCKVDPENLLPCIEGLDFGYTKASPCVFLKFKKNPSFIPEYLDMDALKDSGLDTDYVINIKVNKVADHPNRLVSSIIENCLISRV